MAEYDQNVFFYAIVTSSGGFRRILGTVGALSGHILVAVGALSST